MFPAINKEITTYPVSYTHLDVYKRQIQKYFMDFHHIIRQFIDKFSTVTCMCSYYPVSYTHLDVYKRQGNTEVLAVDVTDTLYLCHRNWRISVFSRWISSVSYTHLNQKSHKCTLTTSGFSYKTQCFAFVHVQIDVIVRQQSTSM